MVAQYTMKICASVYLFIVYTCCVYDGNAYGAALRDASYYYYCCEHSGVYTYIMYYCILYTQTQHIYIHTLTHNSYYTD